MRKIIFITVLIATGWFTNNSLAQSPVPLDVPLRLKITALDTGLLSAYNLYEFEYADGEDTMQSAFIVLKSEDAIGKKRYINARLVRVTEYVVAPSAEGRNAFVMPVTDGIEVSKTTDPGKKSYLNFDPMQPETVFLLKGIVPAEINE